MYTKMWNFAVFARKKIMDQKKSKVRGGGNPSYTEWFSFVLIFNVARYLQLKKTWFLFNFKKEPL